MGSPSAAIRRKLTFGEIMGVCSQFTEAKKGHRHVNTFIGMMLKMTELAKDNSSLPVTRRDIGSSPFHFRYK